MKLWLLVLAQLLTACALESIETGDGPSPSSALSPGAKPDVGRFVIKGPPVKEPQTQEPQLMPGCVNHYNDAGLVVETECHYH